MSNSRKKVYLFALLILLMDQATKIWVKTHMTLGQDYAVAGNWFYILFTENPGMAFGYTLGDGAGGKLILTGLRFAMILVIAWLVHILIRRKAASGLLLGLAAIVAGALGNIIDSAFYGLLFSDSLGQVAQVFPPDGGYGAFLFGHVVDMLYFPLVEARYPGWFPLVGGGEFLFFRPIFNVADAAISVGIFYILIFQRKYLNGIVAGWKHNQ